MKPADPVDAEKIESEVDDASMSDAESETPSPEQMKKLAEDRKKAILKRLSDR